MFSMCFDHSLIPTESLEVTPRGICLLKLSERQLR